VRRQDLECVCGHMKCTHPFSNECTAQLNLKFEYATNSGIFFCGCEKFKLDNLSYIEMEAKRRNLV
jgi:hypothetical protein